MNTLPQAFDSRPSFRAATPAPLSRSSRARMDAHLRLVVGQGGSDAAASAPYGLNGRRHLASVPDVATAPAHPQAAASGADNAGMAVSWTPRRLEPLAFALVLLVSVAALAVAVRAG